MTDENYGKCPVCSADLEPWVPNLRCTKTPEHYAIREALFEEAWAAFERSPMAPEDGIRLMESLLSNNLVENPPTVKFILESIEEKNETATPDRS